MLHVAVITRCFFCRFRNYAALAQSSRETAFVGMLFRLGVWPSTLFQGPLVVRKRFRGVVEVRPSSTWGEYRLTRGVCKQTKTFDGRGAWAQCLRVCAPYGFLFMPFRCNLNCETISSHILCSQIDFANHLSSWLPAAFQSQKHPSCLQPKVIWEFVVFATMYQLPNILQMSV